MVLFATLGARGGFFQRADVQTVEADENGSAQCWAGVFSLSLAKLLYVVEDPVFELRSAFQDGFGEGVAAIPWVNQGLLNNGWPLAALLGEIQSLLGRVGGDAEFLQDAAQKVAGKDLQHDRREDAVLGRAEERTRGSRPQETEDKVGAHTICTQPGDTAELDLLSKLNSLLFEQRGVEFTAKNVARFLPRAEAWRVGFFCCRKTIVSAECSTVTSGAETLRSVGPVPFVTQGALFSRERCKHSLDESLKIKFSCLECYRFHSLGVAQCGVGWVE